MIAEQASYLLASFFFTLYMDLHFALVVQG